MRKPARRTYVVVDVRRGHSLRVLQLINPEKYAQVMLVTIVTRKSLSGGFWQQ